MYNAAFFAILVIVLQFTEATERDLLYILRSAGIMLGTGTYQPLKSMLDTCHLFDYLTGVSVATLFVTKLSMDREKHSTSFKSAPTYTSSNYSTNNASYGSNDPQRVIELQKRLDEKEKEISLLKKGGGDVQYYQTKYEVMYSENQALKNEMFKLKDLLTKNKRESSPVSAQRLPSEAPSSDEGTANPKN